MGKFNTDNLEQRYYSPSDSYEYYDSFNDIWYTNNGQQLRNPSEFKPDEDGCYTPFGDE